MLAMFVLAASCLSGADTGMDLDALRRIVDGLQADLKDVEFTYEGGLTNTKNRDSGQPLENTFQGRFAYRADGSAYMDIFVDYPEPERPIERQITCLSRRTNLDELKYQPDMRGLTSADVRRKYGGIPSLNREMSPFHYWKMPMLLELLRDSGGNRTDNKLKYSWMGWDGMGWEDVGGQRCLKVRFTSEYETKSMPNQRYDFWLDMEHGGTPLRYEDHRKGILWMRTENVKLGRFTLPSGREIWFPISGILRSYIQAEMTAEGFVMKEMDKLIFEKTFIVINGSVALNRSLPDERFTINWSPKPQDDLLKAKRIEHETLVGRPAKSIDLARAKVERTVAEAERQGRLLQASAPSREWAPSTMVGVVALGLLGRVWSTFDVKRLESFHAATG